jgi:hypothetical protein
MQRVVQLVDEWQQVDARERDGAPLAAPLDLGGGGVDCDLVEPDRVWLPGRGIGARQDHHLQRVARLRAERQIRDVDPRIGRLDAPRQFERRQRRTVGARVKERRIEHRVEFVIPRDDRAGQPRDEQEQRRRHTEPAMQPDEPRPHARGTPARRACAVLNVIVGAVAK